MSNVIKQQLQMTEDKKKSKQIEQFVDGLFYSNREQSRLRLMNGNINKKQKKNKLYLTKEDIDEIEIMHPRLSPQQYMDKLLDLYVKQNNMQCREQLNQQMQVKATDENVGKKTVKFARTIKQYQAPVKALNHQQILLSEMQQKAIRQRQKESCFVGLGRMIVKKTVKENTFELTKANIQTREYLRPHVESEVKKLKALHPQIQYIVANANSNGINFEIGEVPGRLVNYIGCTQYLQIMFSINQIIQKTMCNYKIASQTNRKINSNWKSRLFAFFLVLVLYLINSAKLHQQNITVISIIALVLLLVHLAATSLHRFFLQPTHNNPVDHIIQNLNNYFSYVNSRDRNVLFWKTDKFLYWLQIKIIII